MSLCPGLRWTAERGARGRFSAAMGTAPQPEPWAGSCTSALPSLKKCPWSLGCMSEARAVLASTLPSHQGQPCAVYLVWWLFSTSQACSPQILKKKKGSRGGRWVRSEWKVKCKSCYLNPANSAGCWCQGTNKEAKWKVFARWRLQMWKTAKAMKQV